MDHTQLKWVRHQPLLVDHVSQMFERGMCGTGDQTWDFAHAGHVVYFLKSLSNAFFKQFRK